VLKSLPLAEVEKKLGSSPDGLSQAEAQKRLTQYGPNEIGEKRFQWVTVSVTYDQTGQYDAAPGPGRTRIAVAGAGAVWPLESHHPGGRIATGGITAPCVFDGAINGERFRAYVEQMLAPTLRPDDIVLMDNLNSHKVAGIREAIEAQGAQIIYLPPYSPDLNPIEPGFAKLKPILRKLGERTIDGLWQAIGRTVDLYSPQQCRNFFKNAGYAI
jgi:transposase